MNYSSYRQQSDSVVNSSHTLSSTTLKSWRTNTLEEVANGEIQVGLDTCHGYCHIVLYTVRCSVLGIVLQDYINSLRWRDGIRVIKETNSLFQLVKQRGLQLTAIFFWVFEQETVIRGQWECSKELMSFMRYTHCAINVTLHTEQKLNSAIKPIQASFNQ